MIAQPGLDRATQAETPTWELDELLAPGGEGRLEGQIQQLEEQVSAFEARRSELANPTADLLVSMIRDYERLLTSGYKLLGYASLRFAANTQDEDALALRNRLEQLATTVTNRTMFFSLWWQELEDEPAAALLAAVRASQSATADDLFHFEDLRRLRPFRLEERIEQVINLKDQDGIGGVLTLYSLITNAFVFRPAIKGIEEGLTRDELMSYAYSPEPAVREAAYKELHRVYDAQLKPLAQIYIHRVRDWANENVGLRGYSSPIGVRNVANDVPDAAIDAMLDVITESVPLFQRYFRRKAQWLGLEKLRRYDLYAPLGRSDERVSWSNAVATVLDTFERFDPRISALVRRVLEQRHIDAQPRPGKKGGAFCSTVLPTLTPWVLLNYSGRLRDVSTLAHELGHAVHSMLAGDHSLLTAHASLPLAETASVFAEMLMLERLLEETSDVAARRELLAAAIDDVYATVVRQAFFVRFERSAHEAVLGGAKADRLSEIYFELLSEQFGDAIDVAPEFRSEWVMIPHIFSTPFYCYAYSFGQLLVLALYRRYQTEGEAFKPGYFRLLAAGGAAHPQQILSEADVDITDPGFWRGGVTLIEEMVGRLEAV